jgi:hypothetical protein
MTAVEADAGRLKGEADEPGWEVDPDDEWGVAVIATVGRQLKLRRGAVGMVWRQQLEHLLEVGRLRNVTLQIMPTNTDAHPGVDGKIELLKFPDGSAVGRSDGAFSGRPTTDPKQLRILELRYGTIRAQALPPRESLAFIEQVLGET